MVGAECQFFSSLWGTVIVPLLEEPLQPVNQIISLALRLWNHMGAFSQGINLVSIGH